MKRCLILVEGQTEERFVKDLLAPTFRAARGLHDTYYADHQEGSKRP